MKTKKIAPAVQAELAALIEAISDRNVPRAQLIEMALNIATGGRK